MAAAGARSLAALFVVALFVRPRNITFRLPQLLGAAAYAGATILFVTSTKMTTAADAILLQYTSPLYVAVFGALILKEPVGKSDGLMIALIGAGLVLFFFDKLSPGNMTGNILALGSGALTAALALCMRHQKDGSPMETVFLGNVLTVLVCIPPMVAMRPSAGDWLIIAIAGPIQLAAPYILYSFAIKKTPVLNASLIVTLEPVLNPVWVLLFFGEKPGPWSLAGGAMVIGALVMRSLLPRNRPIEPAAFPANP
jgi:drug/metabolite transporter (DMT)-like permease